MSDALLQFESARQVVDEALESEVGIALCQQHPELAELARNYYRDIELADIAARAPVDVLGAVTSQLELAEQRDELPTPLPARVRVSTPTVAENGWTCEHSVVEIVANDEPFIVDSVTAALTQLGRTIKLTIHPIMEREGRRESWLHVEIDYESNAGELDDIQTRLQAVLSDVTAAVHDWSAMVSRANAAAADLRSYPQNLRKAGISKDEASEAAELLDWLASNQFTFLGFREYVLEMPANQSVELVSIPSTGLGILRGEEVTRKSFENLSTEVQQKAREKHLLVLTKANRRSTVHRPTYLDYVGVKTFDEDGNVAGELRFVGLLTAATYANSAMQIPVVRQRVEQVIANSGFEPASHSARDLLHFCETYPRDELFQVSAEQLLEVARLVLAIGERRQTRVFVREDDYGRFASLLVYLPRDRYTTDVRVAITKILRQAYGSDQIDYVARVSDSVLARLHFVVRLASGQVLPDVDQAELSERIQSAVKDWNDELRAALLHELGEEMAADRWHEFGRAFPEAYKEDVSPRQAVADIGRIMEVGPSGTSVALHDRVEYTKDEHQFTLYSVNEQVELFELLPIFGSLGAAVLEERPYEVDREGAPRTWIYDVGIRLAPHPQHVAANDQATRFCEAFLAAWRGQCEVDQLNALVSGTSLSWPEVSWLRSWLQYARQLGSAFSIQYSEQVLLRNGEIARLLVELFRAKFDPEVDEVQRESAAQELSTLLSNKIDAVESLDADRILRQVYSIVQAIVRTNAFQLDADGQPRRAVAHKLEPRRITGVPQPVPAFEIWVSSPRLSGVHLRFGHVARGGLRWSDRPEDMRTEILGLVKAQMVKNAVIVPVGAKGGFFVKDPAVAGVDCYSEFITALLELTDNRVNGEIVPPERTIRYDSDDPYLVVAADKGTASFSDVANAIAIEHGFWLGDAFASGGSNGYDHKEMGITARGAWESVRRHFLGMGVDVQIEPFTVVGIGDMSGDVFGNAMLLSPQIQLVAAFDHRHIFLDPNPDIATSFDERLRLTELGRSSWADYDNALISDGGGVYARTLKSIHLTDAVRQRLGIDASVSFLTPNELIYAILKAPVDLLFNGGIGTYVKSSEERDADVGDKANDAVRVNGDQLRCSVVAEGGNLGLTQAGRVEAARAGVRLNTDAIDNSAGVDCSDHEVNIKILLDEVVSDGDLTMKQRNQLLASMTDEVAALVLAENYRQNLVLSYARAQSADLLPVHERLMHDLEARGLLDRELECLPSDAQIAVLLRDGEGLTSPELCVLLSYVKIALTQDLNASKLASEEWFQSFIVGYFPSEISNNFLAALEAHPLRAQIIATMVANDMVDCGGISFLHRAMEETGASSVEVARAYSVAAEVFALRNVWREIARLDGVAPTVAQDALHLEVRRLLDRATRWVLTVRGGTVDVAGEIKQFRGAVQDLSAIVDGLIVGSQRERFKLRTAEFVELGAPVELAVRVAGMLERFCLLDIDDLAQRYKERPEAVAELYFAVSEHYGFDLLLTQISELPRADRWENLARAAMRSDLYSVLASVTSKILRNSDEEEPPESRIASWEHANREGQQRARATLAELESAGSYDLATISVALRTLRTLVQQGAGGSRD